LGQADAPQRVLESWVGAQRILVLREVEELSYKEIAEWVNIPMGTVMSILSRARQRLSQSPLIFKNQQARVGSARNSHGALSR
jgi:hypothetical protein